MKKVNLAQLIYFSTNHSLKFGITCFFLLLAYSIMRFIDVYPAPVEHHSKLDSVIYSNELKPLSVNSFKLIFGAGGSSVNSNKLVEISNTALNLKLKGILSDADNNKNNQASVIIKLNKQEKFLKRGDKITMGVVLHEIYNDHIILNRGGVFEKLYITHKEEVVMPVEEKTTPRINTKPSLKNERSNIFEKLWKLQRN